MKVLFLQDNPLDESQALIDLAAYLKARGHSCTLLLDRVEKHMLGEAARFDPDLVIVACSMLNHGWARDVAGRLKSALSAPVVMGGTAPTLFPQMLIGAPVDFIVRGESEGPILALLDALDAGAAVSEIENIAGLYRSVPGGWEGSDTAPPIDIADIPATSKDIYYQRYPFMRMFPFKRFLASRGCHHRCTYCYISTLNKVQPRGSGKRVRRKSPEQAVEEVAREAALGPLTHVHFSDDLFTNDKAWMAEFAPLYRSKVGIPFTCNTSAELINDDVAAALAEAGCFAVGFAVETAISELRNKVLRKGVTTDHLRAAAERVHKHGFKLATFNMIALPGETPDQALETALLNAELQTDFVRLNFAFPMPGTGMCDYALENGYLDPDWGQKFGQPNFRYQPGPQFKTPHRQQFNNLFVMFRWASQKAARIGTVRKLLDAPTPKAVHRLLTLQGAWNEKQNFRIPVAAGLKFFAKVGRPEMRATNFPALI